MPTPKEYSHPIQKTEPDLFIIESLTVDDERAERFEGRALRDSLKTIGQRPIYYYVRTAAEFSQAIELFRHSSYRYLHVSCHGSTSSIVTTLEEITNAELATMFSGKLKNRRVFFSSCHVGAGDLSKVLFKVNKGIYSIAAPLDPIQFSTACAFWTAFYTKTFSDSPMSMEASKIKPLLGHLCKFVGIRMNWSSWHTTRKKWIETLIN